MSAVPPQQAQPRMVVFAGPNGSGKSTLIEGLRREAQFPACYINADDIARCELGHIADATWRNLEAAKLAEQRRRQALDQGQSFAYETVMSTPGKLALLQQARAMGFQVELVFVSTRDADINIARVSNRAAMGGHAVAPDKVRQRYRRTMELLPSAVDLADAADIFDNSGTAPLHLASKRAGVLRPIAANPAPAWLTRHLIGPQRERMASRAQLTAAFSLAAAAAGASASPAPLLRDADTGHGSSYTGPVLDATPYHALQQAGSGLYLLHDRALCPPLALEKASKLTIAYQYEKGGKHAVPARSMGGRKIDLGL